MSTGEGGGRINICSVRLTLSLCLTNKQLQLASHGFSPHLTLDPTDGSHRGGEHDEDEGDHDEGEHDDFQWEGEAAGLLQLGVLLVLQHLQLVL